MRRIRLLVAAFVAAFSLTSTLSAAPTIVSPADYSSVQTLTDTMKGYLAGSDLTSDSPSCFSTVDTAARKALCDEYGRSNSIPVTLTWSGTSGECAVKLWRTHKDSEYSPVISTNLTGTSLICYDLEIGRNYSWKVTEGDSSATGHFYVERNAPRILLNWRTEDQENYLIPNGRDLGGWTNTSGKVIKQGLIYRSAYLEWSSPYTHYPLTYLHDDLGIKLDVDLRTIEDISGFNSWGCSWNENEAPLSIDQSPIGPGVRRVCIENATAGLGPNGNGIEFPAQSAFVSQMTNKKDETQTVAQNKIAVWTAFTNICNSVAAGEPVIFHCAHGKDRTGSLGIVIHGLLGVPEADAKRDYALAWFHNEDADFTAIGGLVTRLKGFATSGTFQAGCEAYLVSCGTAASDGDAATKIAAFKAAMIDDVETDDADLADNVVIKPLAASNLAYTGETLTGVAAGAGYTITGNTAVNVGSYTATLTLTDGYSWSDGDTSSSIEIPWSIVKAQNVWTVEPSISLSFWTYNSTPGVLTAGSIQFGDLTVTISKDGAAATTFDGNLPTAVGRYVITYTAPATTDNVIAPAEPVKTVTFDITESDVSVVTNALATALWGYTVSNLGADYNEVAVVFTNDSATMTWTAPAELENVQFLVVGGGGGGGGTVNSSSGGAGGAGGGGGCVVTGIVNTLAANASLEIKVGTGGVGGVHYSTSSNAGEGAAGHGENSYFKVGDVTYITAYGGGGDLGFNENSGVNGGSNSGARFSDATAASAVSEAAVWDESTLSGVLSGVKAFRNTGGNNPSSKTDASGGGGGAGEAGGSVESSTYGGEGGEGLVVSITGDDIMYGSGGSGGTSKGTYVSAPSGAGGSTSRNGENGSPNQGGGGGGGGRNDTDVPRGAGGQGGSGIVVLRYTVAAAVEPEDPEDPDQPGEGDEELTEVAKPAVSYATGTAFTAIGVEQKPVVTPASDAGYTVSYEGDFTSAGTHRIVISLNDGYKWSDGTTGSITYEYTFVDRTYTTRYFGTKEKVYDYYNTVESWYSDSGRSSLITTTGYYPDGYEYDIIVETEIDDDIWGKILFDNLSTTVKAGKYMWSGHWLSFGNNNTELYSDVEFNNDTATPLAVWTTKAGTAHIYNLSFTLTGSGIGYIEAYSCATNWFEGFTASSNIGFRYNTSGEGQSGFVVEAKGKSESPVTTIGWLEGGSANQNQALTIMGGSLVASNAAMTNAVAGPFVIDVTLDDKNTAGTYPPIEAVGALNINEGSTLAVNANSFGAGTYNIIKAGVLNDAADFVRNGTVTGLKSGMYGTFVRNGNQIDLVITTGPTVACTAVAPVDVFNTACASKPITYPCAPTIAGEEGAQTIMWGGVTVDVPWYYSLTFENGVVSMAIRDNAKPVIATVKDESGNVTAEAIKIEGGKVKLHIENTCSNLYYAILSATSLGDDAKWEPYDPSVTTPEYELGKSDFEFDSTDTVRFFKAGVKDEK